MTSLRHVCHDWPDSMATTILQQLRKAAQPHTRLIVHDTIIQYACTDPDNTFNALKTPPEPLLANWGRANSEMYNMDIQVSSTPYFRDLQLLRRVCNKMMSAHFAQERTLTQFRELLAQSGWKLEKVNCGSRPMNVANHSIIAVPEIL